MTAYKNQTVMLCLNLDKDRILQFYVMVSFPDNHTGHNNKPSEFEILKL
jgi:hypothetical protein